jgi:hypothetical protein
MRHRRAPSRRRKPHRRPIVADAIKDRIVQPRRQRLHLLPRRLRAIDNSARRNLLLLPQLPRRRHRRLRANGVSNARHNPHKLRRLHPLRRRQRCLRADNGSNGLSVRRKLRRLHPLPHPLRRRHRRLRANGVSSARHNPHKLRLLRQPRRRHRRLRVNNAGNDLRVRRKLRRLRLLRLQCRLPPRQRLRQNRPIPIRTKNRMATGKTIGPLRPEPIPN